MSFLLTTSCKDFAQSDLCRTQLCGYDLNLTYPQNGFFPTLNAPSATDPNSPFFFTGSAPPSADRRLSYLSSASNFDSKMVKRAVMEYARNPESLRKRDASLMSKRELEREMKREMWKRDLSGRANGTIDSWYACNLLFELYDYMVNFTLPWS